MTDRVRAKQFEIINHWLQQVAQGSGGLLFVMGEWGSGRTTLLREAIAEASRMNILPADAWCRGERVEPVWMPVASLLEQVARAFPDDPAVQPIHDQLDLWMRTPQSRFLPVQLIRALRTLARQQPILLCIDDFHHASEPLVRMIENWLLGIRFEPIGILLTVSTPYDNIPLYELVQRSTEHRVGQVLELPPLKPEEVQTLVETLCPQMAHEPSFNQSLWEHTRGNLLFTVEILRSIASQESEQVLREDWVRLLPSGLRSFMQRSVQSLSPRERTLLYWLSCFEGGIPLASPEGEGGFLAQLTGVPARQVMRSLTQLIGAQWLEVRDGLLWWRHPLVRATIYEQIPPNQRSSMHRQIAELLESPDYASIPDEQKWFQWMRAEPDLVVLERLWEAHHKARYRLPVRVRLELLETCLQVATQMGDIPKRLALLAERPHLLFFLPDGLLQALSASQSAIAELSLHRSLDPERNLWVQTHCAKAGQLAQLGRADEAEAELQTLLQEGGWNTVQQSMLELSLAYVYACRGNIRQAYALHRSVWERMRSEREWWLRWMGTLCYTMRYALACADQALAEAVAEQMSLLTEPMQTLPAWKELWHLMAGEKAFFEGHGAEMLYHVRAMRSLNTSIEASSVVYELGFLGLLYRDASEALRASEQALHTARQAVGYEREAEWLFRKALALIELERFHEAQETLHSARRLAQKMGNLFLSARSALVLAEIALLTHQVAEAESLLAQVRSMIPALDLPELNVEYHRLRSVLAMLCEDWATASESADLAVQCAISWGHALYRGLSHLQRALVCRQNDGAEAARDDWVQAESLLAEYGEPLWWRRAQPAQEKPVPFETRGWDIEIRLLGEMHVRFRHRQITRNQWVSPRARALFAHLVLMQGRAVHTDTLCEQHFPHLPLERARVNLQTTISAVRRSLRSAFGEGVRDWILHDSGFYRWAPPHGWIADAFEFERMAQEAYSINDSEERCQRLDEALRYYRGDLCPEFSEEEWCQAEFQRLRSLYLECLLMRAQLASVKGHYREVVDLCERALQLDPCDEASARLLMRAYHTLGHKTDALQVYARCQKALSEVLGTSPSEPTRQLYQSLLEA